MSEKFSKEQVRSCLDMLKSNPSTCPGCYGRSLVLETVEIDNSGIWQWVRCEECTLTWQNIYKIDAIRFVNNVPANIYYAKKSEGFDGKEL